MTVLRKVLKIGVALLVLVALGGAVALRYTASCSPGAAARAPGGVQAVRYGCYGGPDVLHVARVAKPAPAAGEVLVRVRAAAINPLDWHYMRGEPYVMRASSGLGRPSDPRLGADFAGTVEAVGSAVTKFKVGDHVFGLGSGALSEYMTVGESGGIARKPDNVSFEEAAAVGVAAVTALQALRDKGMVGSGERVLVNGASGGVGTFAVQIAKRMGAHVTGVCSTRNVDLVRSLGADSVIDYTKDDFTKGPARYDVIIDNVGNHPLRAQGRVLTPGGTVVMVGGPSDNKWLGPLTRVVRGALLDPFTDASFKMLLANSAQRDVQQLQEWMAGGTLRSVIDRRYPLDQVADAVSYLETGRARGKVVVTIDAELRP